MSHYVNFSTHGNKIKEAYESVLSSSSSIDWALFGYDKNSNDLMVEETGGSVLCFLSGTVANDY